MRIHIIVIKRRNSIDGFNIGVEIGKHSSEIADMSLRKQWVLNQRIADQSYKIEQRFSMAANSTIFSEFFVFFLQRDAQS